MGCGLRAVGYGLWVAAIVVALREPRKGELLANVCEFLTTDCGTPWP